MTSQLGNSSISAHLPLTMARAALPPLMLFLLALVSLNSGPNLKLVRGQLIWCIAKPSTNDGALKDNLELACTNIDCSPIKEGWPCFYPDTLISQASVAMNLYYQDRGKNDWDCNFNDSGLITVTDPSFGDCKYATSLV